PGGRGATVAQQRRRRVATGLADAGMVQVLTYPFIAPTRHDELGYASGDDRRRTVKLANPLSDAHPAMRTSVLDSLVDAALRNIGRGLTDLAIYEIASVTQPDGAVHPSPLPPPAALPDSETLARVRQAVPAQPLHVAGILAGNRELPGVLSQARKADHADAIELAQQVAERVGARVTTVAAAERAPFHPGRCAKFVLADGAVAGYAGELAPKVTQALELPSRTVAFEVDLDALLAAAPSEPAQYRPVSTYPAAKEDIALVVPAEVPAAELLATVREAGGELDRK